MTEKRKADAANNGFPKNKNTPNSNNIEKCFEKQVLNGGYAIKMSFGVRHG